MMVRPREEATALKVASVVDPDGTYIVRTVLDFAVANVVQDAMLDELI